MELRVGVKGYIHGWIYVGANPHVGQSLTDAKGHPGETGVITGIDSKGVHVMWSGEPHPEIHGASPTPAHADLMNKHEAAKSQGKASLASYYKKKANDSLAGGTPAKSAHAAPPKPAPKPKSLNEIEAEKYKEFQGALHDLVKAKVEHNKAESNGSLTMAHMSAVASAQAKADQTKKAWQDALKAADSHGAPVSPSVPKPNVVHDQKYQDLIAKHQAAKAQGKPSLASYYKKKAAEHLATTGAAKSAAPAAHKTVSLNITPSPVNHVPAAPKPAAAPSSAALKYGIEVTDHHGKSGMVTKGPDANGMVQVHYDTGGKGLVHESLLFKKASSSPAPAPSWSTPKPSTPSHLPKWAATNGDAHYNALVQKHVTAKAQGKASTASYYKKLATEHYAKSGAPSAPASPMHVTVGEGYGAKGFKGTINKGLAHQKQDILDYIAQHPEPGGHKAGKITPESSADWHSLDNHFKAAGLTESKAHQPGTTEAHVNHYTGGAYQSINTGLRTGSLTSGQKATVAHINAAMSPANKDYKLFRGMSGDLLANAKPGDVFADHAVMSTTVTEGSFNTGSSKTLLHITVPKGSPMLWANPISKFKGSENEAILPPETHLAVSKVEMVDGRRHVHVVVVPKHMVPVEQQAKPLVNIPVVQKK